ncbi:MAG: endolytic transglycosylase MltG [Christensenellaceae bacterium]|jgi:UPF0755 protein|nr:endolytic transglycosylase MltG [Christensenellaceae bacterium]
MPRRDDYDWTQDEPQQAPLQDDEERERLRWYEILWFPLRPLLIFATALLIAAGSIISLFLYSYEHYVMPVDSGDLRPVKLVIKRGSSISSIAAQLKDADLIRNKGVFQYLADFSGKGGRLKAGEYELNRSMSVTEIMAALEAGSGTLEVMRFTLVEGLTIEQMGKSLVEQGVFKDDKRFLALCRGGEAFRAEFPFVDELLNAGVSGRFYALEGLLFPDKYEIYVDSSEELVIGKLLSRMNQIYGASYATRAGDLGLNMNQVITLASLIQKEGKRASFERVSAVFHNRLSQNMALGADVTIHYALGINDLVLSQSALDTESPYNTYTHKGLPIGPICNPGQETIEAALYPDDETLSEGYLYFTLTDPETGELAFSKTLKEHNKIVEEYRPLWEEYDKKRKETAAAASPAP